MNRGVQEIEVTADCVPNIGLRGRRRRVVKGIGWLIVTGAVFVALAQRRAGPAFYLIIGPLALYTAILFFQAKEKT